LRTIRPAGLESIVTSNCERTNVSSGNGWSGEVKTHEYVSEGGRERWSAAEEEEVKGTHPLGIVRRRRRRSGEGRNA
jgi:hypothetical protein